MKSALDGSDMKSALDGSIIACGISKSVLEMEWNIQEWPLKSHIEFQGVLYFGIGIFKGVTYFYGIVATMSFDFSRISNTGLENLMDYLQKHFLNHTPCLFFFLEQTTDRETDLLAWVLRSPAYCNALEPLPEFPQNNICYRLQPKYTSFSCFSTICSFAIWKFLYLRNRSYLHHFWYLEGSWPNIIARFYWQNLLCADYSLVHIMKV